MSSFVSYGKLITLEELLKMPALEIKEDFNKDHSTSFVTEIVLSDHRTTHQWFDAKKYENYTFYSYTTHINNLDEDPHKNLLRYVRPGTKSEKALLPQGDLYILDYNTLHKGLGLSKEQEEKIKILEQDPEKLLQEVEQQIRATKLVGSCEIVQDRAGTRKCLGSLIYLLDENLKEEFISRLKETIQCLVQHPNGKKSIIIWMSLCEKLKQNPFCFVYGKGRHGACYANGCIVMTIGESIQRNAAVFYHELNHAIHDTCGINMSHKEVSPIIDIFSKDPWLLNVILGLTSKNIGDILNDLSRYCELMADENEYYYERSETDNDKIIIKKDSILFQEKSYMFDCLHTDNDLPKGWKFVSGQKEDSDSLHISWSSWYVDLFFSKKQCTFEEVFNMLGVVVIQEQGKVKYVINRIADIDLHQYPHIFHGNLDIAFSNYKDIYDLSTQMCKIISDCTEWKIIPPTQKNLDILYQLHLRKPGAPCYESLDKSDRKGKESLFVPKEDLLKEEED